MKVTKSTTASYDLMSQRRATAVTVSSLNTAVCSTIRTHSSPTSVASTTSIAISKAVSITSSATPPPSSSATSYTPTAPAISPRNPVPPPTRPLATSSSTPASPLRSMPQPTRPFTSVVPGVPTRAWSSLIRSSPLTSTPRVGIIGPIPRTNLPPTTPNPTRPGPALHPRRASPGRTSSPPPTPRSSSPTSSSPALTTGTPSPPLQYWDKPRRHPPLLRHKMHRPPRQSPEQACPKSSTVSDSDA